VQEQPFLYKIGGVKIKSLTIKSLRPFVPPSLSPSLPKSLSLSLPLINAETRNQKHPDLKFKHHHQERNSAQHHRNGCKI